LILFNLFIFLFNPLFLPLIVLYLLLILPPPPLLLLPTPLLLLLFPTRKALPKSVSRLRARCRLANAQLVTACAELAAALAPSCLLRSRPAGAALEAVAGGPPAVPLNGWVPQPSWGPLRPFLAGCRRCQRASGWPSVGKAAGGGGVPAAAGADTAGAAAAGAVAGAAAVAAAMERGAGRRLERVGPRLQEQHPI
jgi:hypothetical protein